MRILLALAAMLLVSCGSYNGWGNFERWHGMMIGTTKPEQTKQ